MVVVEKEQMCRGMGDVIRRNRYVSGWEMTREGRGMRDVMRRNRCVSESKKTRKGTDVKGNERCHEKEQMCK